MFSLIRQYALPVIGLQFAALLLLGYLLYGSYTQWKVETEVERDTTTITKTDTVWGGFDFEIDFDDLEPDTVLAETEVDTLVRQDTVYITERASVKEYNEDFTQTLSSGGFLTGQITSKVRGTLLDQNLSIKSEIPSINRFEMVTVTKTVTKTQVGKWRVVGSLGTFYGDGKIQAVAPGIGIQRPTEFSVFYKYDVLNGYHGASVNFPLSLLL